ncbi:uncharacterized protein LOC115211115 [Argonauta hians]
MTSVGLSHPFLILQQYSKPRIRPRTESMAYSNYTWKSEILSKNKQKHNPSSQTSFSCKKKTLALNDKTISTTKNVQIPSIQPRSPSSTQSKQKGLCIESTNRPTLVHSYSTPVMSTTTPRLKPPQYGYASSKTLGSRSMVKDESRSYHAGNSIIPIKSFNSLCSLKDKCLSNKTISGTNSPRFSSTTTLSSPRHLQNVGLTQQFKKTQSLALGARAKPLPRSPNITKKVVNKKVITENKKNQLDSRHIDDANERIISWLIGVEDSEPEEPVAPFIEYSDKPLQTDIAVHIVFNGD